MEDIFKPTEFKFIRVPADTERITIPKGSISISIVDIPEIDDTLYHRQFYTNVTYVQWLEPNDSTETIVSFNKQMRLLAEQTEYLDKQKPTKKTTLWKRFYNFIFHE